MALIIALSALIPMAGVGTLSSAQYVPMPPGDFKLDNSDPHFDIYYDSARITDVGDALIAANDTYYKVTGFFGPFDYRAKIILASDHPQYANILTLSVPGAGDVAENDVASAWGDGERGTIVIESPDQLPNFATVLAHEFSHIAMRTRLIDNKYTMPVWFSDGLAIYVSGDLSGTARAAVEDACRNGKLMTVAQMEDIAGRSADPATNAGEASLASAQSAMLMEYIATKYGNDTVKLIMQDFAPTGDLDKAFMRRLGYSPEGINADWMMSLKGQLSVKDGVVLSQRVYGYVLDASGKPMANETIAFTSMRNDSAVFGKTYTAVTNDSGYYKLNLTYGPFIIQLDKPGYADVDENITLQKSEVRLYNVTLAKASGQNVLASPEASSDLTVYIVLGILNAAAILLIVFVFWRARK
jgi:hypothetical protein